MTRGSTTATATTTTTTTTAASHASQAQGMTVTEEPADPQRGSAGFEGDGRL